MLDSIAKKSGLKKCLEILPLKNFHFDYLNPSLSNSDTKLLQDFEFGPRVLTAHPSLTIITKKWSRLKYISKLLVDHC